MKVYQRIFEYTPDALLLIDQAGRITLANAQAETLFGYDRRELIGQPVEMLVPSRVAARHVDHRDAFMAESHSRQMGTAVELFARRKDGSELAVDIMLSPMPIDGRHFTLCVARDITERKAADDKLRQQTAELQKLHAELPKRIARSMPPRPTAATRSATSTAWHKQTHAHNRRPTFRCEPQIS